LFAVFANVIIIIITQGNQRGKS